MFYLAARALAGGSADPDAVAAAAEQLRQRRFRDLSALHLQGAGLGGAHLDGADLHTARLEHADLLAAHLDGATLRGAR